MADTETVPITSNQKFILLVCWHLAIVKNKVDNLTKMIGVAYHLLLPVNASSIWPFVHLGSDRVGKIPENR